jgi:hypothetical protein
MFLLQLSQHNITIMTNAKDTNVDVYSISAIRLYTILITSNINVVMNIASFRLISSLRVLIT